ncbi:DEAD/DEAH box helicase, partial [Paenibacillus sp. TAF58]
PREIDHLHFIEKVTRHKINKKPLPSLAEAIEGKQKMTAERILDVLQNDTQAEFKGLAIQMLEQYDSVNLLAAAMKLLTGDKKETNIELTPEDPIRARKKKFDVRSSGRRVGGGYGSSSGSGDRRQGGGYSSGAGSSSSNSRYPRKDSRDYGSNREGGSSSSSRNREYGSNNSGNRDRSRAPRKSEDTLVNK